MTDPRFGSGADIDEVTSAPGSGRRSLGVALAVGAAVAVALFGSFLLVLTPSLGDRPGLQTLWVLFSLVLLKVPLLLLVWWMIVRRHRRRGTRGVPSEPAAAFIDRIDREAARVAGQPDAADRLAGQRVEAWSRIERAGDAEAPALVELALRLERPAGRGAAVARRP
jgi:hypothetical protein